jgi:hypothetical protein
MPLGFRFLEFGVLLLLVVLYIILPSVTVTFAYSGHKEKEFKLKEGDLYLLTLSLTALVPPLSDGPRSDWTYKKGVKNWF